MQANIIVQKKRSSEINFELVVSEYRYIITTNHLKPYLALAESSKAVRIPPSLVFDITDTAGVHP